MVEKLSQFDLQARITKQLSDIHNKRIVNKATVLKDAANTHAAILYSPLIKTKSWDTVLKIGFLLLI
jgi:hypothetical protein